ncbi:MAG: hypothetical protein KKE62_07415 [Proteobacteria bacterium]|nr:hypothetical protein [Pseudomonadota bacterium]MBU1389721.1 hypothetical protein [Pseudomonadota bacterium]MBU1542659.1 hypothetical protein [Pseudomonadota bacterium]MBU2430675.1 hypothetical protein [Pseudomonadota bacterium]MBU2480728.1 hypothetical protein [Pseudomonadota bacterium]
MLKHLSETETLKRFVIPPGDPPDNTKQGPLGSISVFPISPLDMPSETFEKALKRREKNHQTLIQWIRANLHPDIDYGRSHIVDNCKYARSGVPHLCHDFSHFSMLTLWKSGAEKIIRLLGLTAHFPNLNQYELACVHRQEIQVVMLKCELQTQTGTIVGEGTGARHIKQDDWNLNTSIKIACKSAMVDAVIRTAGLTGVFLKTHRHTLNNNLPDIGTCNYNLTPPANRNSNGSRNTQQEKPITQKQKDLIQTIAGRKGLTIESLKKQVHSLFKKDLDDLDRVEASKLVQHLNG